MRLTPGLRLLAPAALLLIAACTSQREPAEKLLRDIDASVNASAADAAKYAPDQLDEAQHKLGDLKASFDKEDYKAVVAGAPAVYSAAESLAGAAAAKKAEVNQGLADDWSTLSTTLPAHASELQNRTAFLGRKENKKLAAGVDLDAASSSLGEAQSLWSKASAAYAAGNLPEAVSTAKGVKTQLDALAASMKLDFSQPAAVRDTSP